MEEWHLKVVGELALLLLELRDAFLLGRAVRLVRVHLVLQLRQEEQLRCSKI